MINTMQNTVRYMRVGKGVDCAAVAMLVNEAHTVHAVLLVFQLSHPIMCHIRFLLRLLLFPLFSSILHIFAFLSVPLQENFAGSSTMELRSYFCQEKHFHTLFCSADSWSPNRLSLEFPSFFLSCS